VISTVAGDVSLRLAEDLDLSPKELKTMMGEVLGMVERMAGTVDHLRVFSRDKSNEPGVLFDVNEVVESSLKLIGTQLRSRGIALQLELSEGLPAVNGHPHQMEQVLLNLLRNARDALDEKEAGDRRQETGDRRQPGDSSPYAPSSSRSERIEGQETEGVWEKQLFIRTRREGDGVVLEVEDNGTGMDESVRSRLFEPFFTTKPADRGTGLGLSISYAIVRDHGGQIACESRAGEGTMFRVTLPAAET
jgi:signal transduction histidine kinase